MAGSLLTHLIVALTATPNPMSMNIRMDMDPMNLMAEQGGVRKSAYIPTPSSESRGLFKGLNSIQEISDEATVLRTEDEVYAAHSQLASRADWNQRVSEDFREAADQYAGSAQPSNDLGKDVAETNYLYFAQLKDSLDDLSRSSGIVAVNSNTVAFNSLTQGAVKNSQVDDSATPFSSQSDSIHSTQSVETTAPEKKPHFVKAFRSEIPVEHGQTKKWSMEYSAQGASRGWRYSFELTRQYWPTISWYDDGRDEEEFVPFLSSTELETMGLRFFNSILHPDQNGTSAPDLTQYPEAGIVFGKVAAGWDVVFSEQDFLGRADAPIFFSPANNSFGNENKQEERYFIFRNVNPGSRIISLVSQDGSKTGGIAFPVLPGTSTYLDLSQPVESVLTTRVVAGSIKNPKKSKSFEGVEVSVLGSNNSSVMTDSWGRIPEQTVVTAGSYPIFIETDYPPRAARSISPEIPNGYTHRYQVFPDELENVKLVRYPNEDLDYWVSDTQGSVVGHAPDLAEKFENNQLIPNFSSLGANPSPVGVTYTQSESHILTTFESSFMGVQLPEGPTISEVLDEKGNLKWGEVTYISPRVVNVVRSIQQFGFRKE